MERRDRVKQLWNWANLSTPLGLLVARVGGASTRPGPRGLVLAEGYRLGFPVASAFTVGNVVITSRDVDTLERERPGTLAHEEQHTRQYAYCLGLPFFPSYLATMAWSWLRTGDKASACHFEQEAGLDRGGYPTLPRRPLRAGVADLTARLRDRGRTP